MSHLKIRSLEPTPNPNSMKLNMDQSLPEGVKWECTNEGPPNMPRYLRALLQIKGVRSVYQVADFIALERSPASDWRGILARVHRVFEQEGTGASRAPLPGEDRPFGAVRVYLQVLRGLPMQIKLLTDEQDARVPLPERFKAAAMKVAEVAPDLLAERRWLEKGVRYGPLPEIGAEVAQQVAAAYDEERLARLLEQALLLKPGEANRADQPLNPDETAQRLTSPDWRLRLAALDRLEPNAQSLPVILQALQDPHASVRRLATVYLGAVGASGDDGDAGAGGAPGDDGAGGDAVRRQVLPHLLRALRDRAVPVRRAAGDCLSDLGDPAAIGPMTEALQDPSRLVRWRAARFLYEVGDASALSALRGAQDDPEFEVSLQVRMAIERIEGGKEAAGPVWQQMTRLISDSDQS